MKASFNGLTLEHFRENCRSTQSFNSTVHSSTSPTSLQEVPNKNFNLNELLISPNDGNFHRRLKSHASNFLNPKNLFSGKSSKSQRNSLEGFHRRQAKKENFLDSDEGDTSKSQVFKRFDENELNRSNLPKIFVRVLQNMRFCRKCDKIVEIFEDFYHQDTDEGKVFQFFCVVAACWQPRSVQQLKCEKCCECGNVVF
jgi:hypothetical protein